jgi:hypothetical protein
MKFLNTLAAALLAAVLSVAPVFADGPPAVTPTPTAGALVQNLQDISVTIRAGGSQGSGTLFTRKVDDKNTVTFVWTAGHVIDGLRKVRTVIDPESGSPKLLVEFEDAEIVREFTEDGRRIGEMKFDARVVKYSDARQGEDLALLIVRKRNYVGEEVSASFYLDEAIPPIGTELYHVGSLLGQVGSNSLTTGVVSQIGRVLNLGANGVIFDQTTVTAFPGSSGGGVFLKTDGRYVGMLVRGAGEQFNFTVPARRLVGWAKRVDIEWAVNPAIKLPSLDEIAKLKIEDTGVKFNSNKAAADAKDPHAGDEPTDDENAYGFLLAPNPTFRGKATKGEPTPAKPSVLVPASNPWLKLEVGKRGVER